MVIETSIEKYQSNGNNFFQGDDYGQNFALGLRSALEDSNNAQKSLGYATENGAFSLAVCRTSGGSAFSNLDSGDGGRNYPCQCGSSADFRYVTGPSDDFHFGTRLDEYASFLNSSGLRHSKDLHSVCSDGSDKYTNNQKCKEDHDQELPWQHTEKQTARYLYYSCKLWGKHVRGIDAAPDIRTRVGKPQFEKSCQAK